MTFEELVHDPDFLALDDASKAEVRKEYFEREVLNDPYFVQIGRDNPQEARQIATMVLGSPPPTSMDEMAQLFVPGYPVAKSAVGSVVETMKDPSTAGATIGSLAAGASGFGLPAAVGMAALGGMGGEAVEQIGQHAGAFGGQPPATTEEASRRMLGAGAVEGATELGGGLLFKGAKKLAAPMAANVTPAARRVMTFLRNRYGEGMFPYPSPASMTESAPMDLADNIARNSIFGSGIYRAADLEREDFQKNMAKDFADELGDLLPADELGRRFADAVKAKKEAARSMAEAHYNTVKAGAAPTLQNVTVQVPHPTLVDPFGNPVMIPQVQQKLVGGVEVNIQNVKKRFETKAAVLAETGKHDPEITGSDVVSRFMGMNDELSWAAADQERKTLVNQLNKFRKADKTSEAVKIATDALTSLTDAMEGALKSQAPNLLPHWQAGRALWLGKKTTHETAFMNRLLRKANELHGAGAPEKLTGMIFETESNIRRARQQMGNDWQYFQRWKLQDVYNKASNRGAPTVEGLTPGAEEVLGTNSGLLDHEQFMNELFEPGGQAKEWVRAAFATDQIAGLRGLGEALRIYQAKNPTGLGTRAVEFTQAGATIATLGQTLKGQPHSAIALAADVTIIAPPILSKLMNNPKTARWLAEGINLPARSREATTLTARILREALAAELDDFNARRDAGETFPVVSDASPAYLPAPQSPPQALPAPTLLR